PLDGTVFRSTFNVVGDNAKTIEEIRTTLETISDDADEIALAAYLALDDTPYSRSVVELAQQYRIVVPDEVVSNILQPLVPEFALRYSTVNLLVSKAYQILQRARVRITKSKLQDAVFAVTSRAFYLITNPKQNNSRDVVMVPCGDLFNHEESKQSVRFVVE